jgi:hypothetical protein
MIWGVAAGQQQMQMVRTDQHVSVPVNVLVRVEELATV